MMCDMKSLLSIIDPLSQGYYRNITFSVGSHGSITETRQVVSKLQHQTLVCLI